MKYQKSNAIVPDSYWTTEIPEKPGLYLWEDPGTKQLEPSLVIINKDKRAWVDNTGRFCDLMGGRWTPLYNKVQLGEARAQLVEVYQHTIKLAKKHGAQDSELHTPHGDEYSIVALIDILLRHATKS